MFKRLIYVVGRRVRLVRLIYWRLTNGKYLWGIIGYIRDRFGPNVKSTGISEDAINFINKIEKEIFKIGE